MCVSFNFRLINAGIATRSRIRCLRPGVRLKLNYHRHEVGGLKERTVWALGRLKVMYHRHEVGGLWKCQLRNVK